MRKELLTSFIHELLQQEGIVPQNLTFLGVWGDSSLVGVAEKLMASVPHPEDPHWSVIVPLARVTKGVRDAALLANYAGDPPSQRHQYGRILGEEAFRQHCRAAVNVAQARPLRDALAAIPQAETPFTLQLAQTRRVTGGPDGRGITPCPEAVHQVRMFDPDGNYLGRVGFNVHREGGDSVVTIANIQGVPGKGPIYDQMRRQEGIDPFVRTLEKTKALVASVLPGADLRAVIPPKAKRPKFYERVLEAAGIKDLWRQPR